MTRARILRLAALTLWAVASAAVVLEIGLRASVSWHPGYYVVRDRSGGQEQRIRYPFGEIRMSAEGIADDLPKGDRPVVAWMGDSVLYGLGCGSGHRVTELLEAADPTTEQLNLGVPGFSARPDEWRQALNRAIRHGAREAVWLLNLNDVVPDPGEDVDGPKLWLLPHPEILDRSYLFTAFDESFKTLQMRSRGVRQTEAAPRANARVFDETAARIRKIQAAYRDAGAPLTVLVLPYEMQISAEAEAYYRDAGVSWEDGFVEGSAQRALAERVDGIVDLRPAFLGARRREDIRLGELFVATEGGRLDWDHLNRAGHRAVADWLVQAGIP